MPLRVRLGDHGEVLAGTREGQLEGETHYACYAGAREDGNFGRDCVGGVVGGGGCPAMPGVFAFAVFADAVGEEEAG